MKVRFASNCLLKPVVASSLKFIRVLDDPMMFSVCYRNCVSFSLSNVEICKRKLFLKFIFSLGQCFYPPSLDQICTKVIYRYILDCGVCLNWRGFSIKFSNKKNNTSWTGSTVNNTEYFPSSGSTSCFHFLVQ